MILPNTIQQVAHWPRSLIELHCDMTPRRGMQGDLDSFLIEISSMILPKKDDKGDGFLVDKILDKTGMKGTGPQIASLHNLQLY